METNEITTAPEHYNANQIVTYKSIENENISFPTIKVSDLEWKIDQSRRDMKELIHCQGKINLLEDKLANWIENNTSAENIVEDICEIFGFNATKEVEFEGTATFTGTVSVPLSEISSFDISDIDFSVEVTSWSTEVNIHDTDIDIDLV